MTSNTLILNSPAGGKRLQVIWNESTANLAKEEIITAMNLSRGLFPISNKNIFDETISVFKISKDNSFEFLLKSCQDFNKKIRVLSHMCTGMLRNDEKVANGVEHPNRLEGHKDYPQVLDESLELALGYCNTKMTALRAHYKIGTSEVYGAATYDRIVEILKDSRVHAGSQDVFLDLGSGIGNVVFQVASSCKIKKAIGIEINPLPAKIAEKTKDIFERYMKWLGKTTRPIELIEGDFLDQNHVCRWVTEPTIIFMNNYAFKPPEDRGIIDKIILNEGNGLRDGTRIITSKKLAPARSDMVLIENNGCFREYRLRDILETNCYEFPPLKPDVPSATWTANHVSYYLYIIDRDKVIKTLIGRIVKTSITV